jgi:hypothetical protein
MPPGRHRLLLLSALLLACGPGTPPDEVAPLVDGRHAPLILTESSMLEMPPSYTGNRFLAGWWPWRRRGSTWQVNVGDKALLEAVFLDGRERRLSMLLEIGEAEPQAMLGVRVAGSELAPVPLQPEIEIPLPGGLPRGRLPIELDFAGARVSIQAAGFGHTWQPGEVDVSEEMIVQGGYSAIDFPRRLVEPATLVGRFEPPSETEPDQRFAILIETEEEGGEVAFEWRPGERTSLLGSGDFRLDLPAGLVRVRLLAQGLGGACRWLGLGIAGGSEPADEEIRLATGMGRDGAVYSAASERYKLVLAPGLGLDAGEGASRDPEYVFDLRLDPTESRNLAGSSSLQIDLLRARLEAWVEGQGGLRRAGDTSAPPAGEKHEHGPTTGDPG